MQISEIMDLIDEEKLNELDKLYKIDKVNNKITGKFILKSFVHCILKGYKLSLRALELITNNNKNLSSLLKTQDKNNNVLDHSSISKRLSSIDTRYFEDIYINLVIKYNDKFKKLTPISYIGLDSTIITLSGKLLKDGLNLGGKTQDRHIKISVGLKNSIPSSVRFCSQQSESSENIALVQAINATKIEKEEILLFDRGLSKAQTFEAFTKNEQYFITRANINRKYALIQTNRINTTDTTEEDLEQEFCKDLTIISDEIVNLYDKNHKEIKCNLRLIKANSKTAGELWFLSNILYLSAQDIASSYKKRWEIEVFFKFIKQNLQIKHFISHRENGMKVYIYCILIAAILFAIFKKVNNLLGFKLVLLQFTLLLEKEIIKDIVLFCGGDPNLVDLKL
ncbi:MAG: IS4 family transposase [Candidatus Tisiphia sp.]|nr:IS4 family transposase [Candidatus Tisiphia sp.]